MMMMTKQALANDRSIGVPLVPVSEIYIDHEFNCRGWFSATDCTELAKDIGQRGLQQPIIVRPVTDHDDAAVRERYKYVVIAGHRRLFSYRINSAETIPAIVKIGLTDFQAKDINAVENIHRKDLNLWQEAYALKVYVDAGWSEKDIAEHLSKSRGWVQVRTMLLKMPKEVQEAAAQGFIKHTDIRELAKYRDANKLLKAAGILVDKRKKGDKRDIFADIRNQQKIIRPMEKRVRKREEMFNIVFILQDILKDLPEGQISVSSLVSQHGNFIGTRLLSWAAGEISNMEIHTDIQNIARVFGRDYELPDFDMSAVLNVSNGEQ